MKTILEADMTGSIPVESGRFLKRSAAGVYFSPECPSVHVLFDPGDCTIDVLIYSNQNMNCFDNGQFNVLDACYLALDVSSLGFCTEQHDVVSLLTVGFALSFQFL